MLHWTRRLLVVAGMLSLTGCLWGPGKFASDLTLRKDGTFVLNYRGEIVLQTPPDAQQGEPWKDSMAACSVSDGKEMKATPCTKAQIATQRADYEGRAAAKRKATEGYVGRYMENLERGFEDDVRIWEHKVYREPPVLCDGDGPIGRLRTWYRKFYPAAPASGGGE